jgi:hypothetical protein
MTLANGRQRIPELNGIEFTGHSSVVNYSKTLRALMRDIATEVEFGAEELFSVLSRQRGHPLLMGVDVKMRARKVVKRLYRVHDLAAGGAVEAVKFYREFRLQFADAIQPQRSKPAKAFDFDDE